MELEILRNEVFFKLGRNIANFQKVELKLKFLIEHSNFEVNHQDRELNRKRSEQIQKQTMGMLVGDFLSNICSLPEEKTDVIENSTTPFFSFNFRQVADSLHDRESEKNMMESFVASRNELVHHFILRFDLNTLEGCKNAGIYLDHQREDITPVLNRLNVAIKAMQDAREVMLEHISSDQFRNIVLYASPIALLSHIASQHSRPDGWTFLSTAGKLIRQLAPDEMENLKERYGHKKLKELILASDFFDLIKEPTDNNGIRLLYRIKPNSETEFEFNVST